MSGTAGSIVCPACGAGVSKAAKACPYCGAEVVLPKPKGAVGPAERRTYCTRCGQMYAADVARCPRCPPAAEWDRGGRCPRCGTEMETHPVGGVTTDRCASCGGTWFDGDEVEHAIDVTTKGVSREEADAMRRALPVPPTASEPIRYLPCVRCGERMQRRQVAPRAGTIVDVCRDHGVWFDGGEFERFAQFVKSGGLDVLRHDGVAAAEARRKAVEAEKSVRAHGGLEDMGLGGRHRMDPSIVLTGAVARDILRTIGRLFRG